MHRNTRNIRTMLVSLQIRLLGVNGACDTCLFWCDCGPEVLEPSVGRSRRFSALVAGSDVNLERATLARLDDVVRKKSEDVEHPTIELNLERFFCTCEQSPRHCFRRLCVYCPGQSEGVGREQRRAVVGDINLDL